MTPCAPSSKDGGSPRTPGEFPSGPQHFCTVPSSYANGVSTRLEDEVAVTGVMLKADKLRDDAERNGGVRVRKTVTPRSRKPTPLQTARWKAVQKAKRKGLSIRGIARELGIHRDTVRKYMNAESPPMSRARATLEVS